LNGFAALILVTALAFAPQSATDPRRLSWAMLVFGSGALAGLLSSLLAYISRTAMVSSQLVVQDLLRVGAIIAAIGSGPILA
jgi:RsiW-degrading membrane proteinase PrsW (M82 family)